MSSQLPHIYSNPDEKRLELAADLVYKPPKYLHKILFHCLKDVLSFLQITIPKHNIAGNLILTFQLSPQRFKLL